jgi:hypothetical protein
MSDDIVTRLMHCTDYDCDLLGDAGREIERLRAQVAAWKDVAQELTMYAAMQELKAAAHE